MTPKQTEHHGKPHHRSHLAATGLNRIQVSKRRSSRMALHASVGLRGEDSQKSPFSMPAKATNLNRHGAAVHLCRDIPVGAVVTLKNQRGTEVPARVVAILAARAGTSTYGVEFVEHDEKSQNFWGISFPTSSNA
jgi:hypothetical protein